MSTRKVSSNISRNIALHTLLARFIVRLAGIAALCASAAVSAQGSAGPYVPTPWPIVDEMFKAANIKKGDYLIDIGSGDGRLVIEAAKRFGARGLGIDIQPPLVELATANAAKEKVSDRVEFVVGDIFETNLLSRASIITVYLLPSIMDKLVPKLLRDLKPGTRIVSHDYPLEGMKHDSVQEFNFKEKLEISGTTRTVIYHYTVPAK